MIRKILFWTHLSAGVLAGLIILMMSATGVLLTYERQVLAWADSLASVEPPAADAARLGVPSLLEALAAQDADFTPTSLTFRSDDRLPVVARAGRSGSRYLDPYSGEPLRESAPRLRAFFRTMVGWHRWFNVSGEHRATARAITGASNLLFLFIILSGLYLWLPPVYRRAAFIVRFWFNPKVNNSKARDFNWHHVFGIWTALPLAVVVASALIFSYGWANDLVYRAVGEEPPLRGRGGPPRSRPAETPAATSVLAEARLSLDELTARAARHDAGWRTLTLNLPDDGAAEVRFTIDHGNGGQPQRRQTLTLDAASGAVLSAETFSDLSAGRRARTMLRFLHTGEALGIAGQTIAGFVSLTSLLMVWTGLALAWRRLISPLLRRRKTVPASDLLSSTE